MPQKKSPPERLRRADGNNSSRDKCALCGAVAASVRGTVHFPINGEEVAVPNVRHTHCSKCGETVFSLTEARRLREDASDLYRRRYDLLTADEIRALRRQLRLTQGELARLLRLGASTISRWEAGRNVQNGAMDVLLRLLRDLPGSLAYLKRRAA